MHIFVIKLNNIVYLNGYIVHFMDYVLVNGLKVIIFIEDIYIYIWICTFGIYNLKLLWRSKSRCYWIRLVYTVPAGLPHIRSKMSNIQDCARSSRYIIRLKKNWSYKKLCWFMPNWGRLFLLVKGHTSVKCIVNWEATGTNQCIITEIRYTCGWKHLNLISTHWNFLRHF